MIIIENTIISDDIVTKTFCCDIAKCKGQCCIEGDAGAPLEEEEIMLLEKHFPAYKEFITSEGLDVITKTGFFTVDYDNDFLTPLLANAACVYAFTENGIMQCAIEKAYELDRIRFKKPISCHLYPIRISKLTENIAVNYHNWDICADAKKLGIEKQIPLYIYLKEPLIRKFGQEWYDVLCASVTHLND